jgi:hypothetical protein
MKMKVHEDGTNPAKTRFMLYYAKVNDYILRIRPWQNDRQCSVNNVWFSILGTLSGNWLQPFINAVLAGL